MRDEIAQLKATGTFEWAQEAPEGRKVVGSRWVFKEKRDGKGNLVKYKARVVAQGFSQVPGQDFNATYASVAKFTTLRALLALCASIRSTSRVLIFREISRRRSICESPMELTSLGRLDGFGGC
jgi:hypothetical protein